jgi:hypothetical protein
MEGEIIRRLRKRGIMQPVNMTRIVDGKRYSTQTATLLASDAYWDGSNHERHGRNCYLYRTPRGRYFCLHLTMWQGEQDRIEPVTAIEARELYEGMAAHDMADVSFEDAFPNVAIEDA